MYTFVYARVFDRRLCSGDNSLCLGLVRRMDSLWQSRQYR